MRAVRPPAAGRCGRRRRRRPPTPPLASCSAAHRRVSAGRSGSGARSGCGARAASSRRRRGRPIAVRRRAARNRWCRPGAACRSRCARRSPSRSLPSGPPASASGPTWPMHGPVETPEKRASVTSGDVACAQVQVLERGRHLVRLLHAGAERAAAAQDDDVARLDRVRALALDGRDGGALGREDARAARRGGRRRRRRARSGSMAVLFTIAPSGARLPPTKRDRAGAGRARARGVRGQDHVVGIDAVRDAQPRRAGARGAPSPPTTRASRRAVVARTP